VHVSAERIQSAQLARVSASFLRLRPKLLLPVGPVLLGLMWWAEVPRGQLIAIGLNYLFMLSWFWFEAWSVRKTPVSHDAFCGSLLITLFGLSTLCGFSGGSRSPFLPILFAPLGIAFAAFGKGRRAALVFAAFIVVLAYLVLSNALWSWPLPERVAGAAVVLASVLASVLLYFGVTGLAEAYRETALNLEATRGEVLEAAQEQTRSLQHLGSQVAHELKNPLASIKGLVQLLAQSPNRAADARSGERLDVVLQEVLRMEQVLGEYLSFARPLSNVTTTTQPLRPFLLDLVKLVEGEAHHRQVELNLTCPEVDLGFDAARLRQALLNLVQNALAAMPRGGRLGISAKVTQHSVELCIADTGSGMTAEVLLRVKEPYFSRSAGGTGLGVVIADGIVRQHGGALRFESTEGHGARAFVHLPRPQGAGAQS
jgi:signal transduction histidine kinase